MQLEKVYEPQRFEPHWAQWWIESGIYRADAKKALQGRMFSIVIPPPNVTGSLHIGHILAKRRCGCPAPTMPAFQRRWWSSGSSKQKV
jgi:isoleucyl-tRNA synthetase